MFAFSHLHIIQIILNVKETVVAKRGRRTRAQKSNSPSHAHTAPIVDHEDQTAQHEPIGYKRGVDIFYPFKSAGIRNGAALYLSPLFCFAGSYAVLYESGGRTQTMGVPNPVASGILIVLGMLCAYYLFNKCFPKTPIFAEE